MSGWKTYLCAAGAVIVLGLRAAGQTGVIPILAQVPADVWEIALWLLGFGGLAALRAAVAKATAVPLAESPAPSREPELPSDAPPLTHWQ
jgi:hypothetical protein